MAPRWLMAFGTLGLLACSAPVDRNPALRCAAEGECPLELSCYRGYCVDSETEGGSGVSDDRFAADASTADGQTVEASEPGGEGESDAGSGGAGLDESDPMGSSRDAASVAAPDDAGAPLADSQVPSTPAPEPPGEPAPPAAAPPTSEPAPPPAEPPSAEPSPAEPAPPAEPTPPAEPPAEEPTPLDPEQAAQVEAWSRALREAGLPEEALLCVPSCVLGGEDKECRKCVERMLKGEDAEGCERDDDDDDESPERSAICALLDCGSRGCGRKP